MHVQVQLEEDTAEGTLYNAHVQEINEPKGPVVVFIEELGEKKTVSYSCLRPLPLSATTKQGCDFQNFPIAQLGYSPYGDRRSRSRRKTAMPSATEFQPPLAPVRSPRPSTAPRVCGAEASQPMHTTVTSQPLSLECLPLDSMGGEGGVGYCSLTTTSLPLAPAAGPPGQGGSGGVVYWMPVVSVPYASSMGQVNLAWAPSQDPYGKDLPLADTNTLRYFFNLGVEYFRISANMQQQQQQQPQQSYMTSAMPQVLAGCPPTSTVYVPLDQGASFAGRRGRPPPGERRRGESRVEGMEMGSDVSDNGFASSGEGGHPGGEEDVDLSSNRTDDDCGSTQGEEGGSDKGGSGSSSSSKGKGKRKYYMYGPHKLIKPIKDIPPRFQLMLAENSAAKARCEGQPIYMHLSPADFIAMEQPDAGSGLNADAQCFYPGHSYDTIMLDESGLATFATTNGAHHHHHHPPPPPIIMPPPHPGMQAGVGTTPVSVVYSSLPSCSSAALPPPTFTRHAPPRDCSGKGSGVGEGQVVPVVVAGGPPSLGKAAASSGPDKRSKELAVASALQVSACSTSASSSPHGCLPSFSLSGVPPSAAFPVVSTSMPPPLSAPPLHAGSSAHPPGGGKQCFYVYSSPSAGYPSLPATPAQGPSLSAGPGGLSQGQVVYVMNPQGYGPAPPPPCTAYQPALMAPAPHTMGVAVQ
ncbi:hypothetical protein ACOMHN_007523 [Nucella lapillus]